MEAGMWKREVGMGKSELGRWNGECGIDNSERLPFHFRIPHSDFRIHCKILVYS